MKYHECTRKLSMEPTRPEGIPARRRKPSRVLQISPSFRTPARNSHIHTYHSSFQYSLCSFLVPILSSFIVASFKLLMPRGNKALFTHFFFPSLPRNEWKREVYAHSREPSSLLIQYAGACLSASTARVCCSATIGILFIHTYVCIYVGTWI